MSDIPRSVDEQETSIIDFSQDLGKIIITDIPFIQSFKTLSNIHSQYVFALEWVEIHYFISSNAYKYSPQHCGDFTSITFKIKWDSLQGSNRPFRNIKLIQQCKAYHQYLVFHQNQIKSKRYLAYHLHKCQFLVQWLNIIQLEDLP